MSVFIDPKLAPVGSHYLVFDMQDEDWALWKQLTKKNSEILVDWCGGFSDQMIVSGRWGREKSDRYRAYIVRPENVDAIIMAARHMTTEQWYRFAWRQSERQAL